MIKINKPADVPEILAVQGKQRRRTHCANFNKYEAEYRDGTRTFPFDATIYAHETVKAALVKAQYGKCCFCESKIGADGDVEHFRPKAGCRQNASDALLRPGYYWLAYEWDNLLLACGPCNQRFKGNLFPLLNGGDRALCHKDDLPREQPLFINPAEVDPQTFISFRQEIAFPLGAGFEGETTINALGLNRENLREKRRDRLAEFAILRDVLDCELELSATAKGRGLLKDATRFLARAVHDEAEYASMARAAQARDFRI